MEKFSQFRDRGTQIAPFLPIKGTTSVFQNIYGVLLFLFRLPFFLCLSISYFLVFQWLPIGSLARKTWLWSILLSSGVWWVDLQVEGVKKGSLAKKANKLPKPHTVILSSFNSPLDAIYIAAIFDPVFTASYPTTKKVEQITLLTAILRAFSLPLLSPPKGATLATVATLLRANPTRTIVVFPEATTTNGRGILRFAPSLDTTPKDVAIFPISLRYTPADVTTPIPETYFSTLYNLLSRPTHCIRVRIAEAIYNKPEKETLIDYGHIEDYHSDIASSESDGEETRLISSSSSDTITDEKSSPDDKGEKQSRLSEKGGEALARISRSKRLNLGVKEKMKFVEAWGKNKRG
ncbi:Lysophosphatidic acid:oleoyl-CoA acyltransferase 1 [Maublancomyces gigas]|uniref:Lysophosphatidic acid:oleoyl-CoA acyltransferase 1 n=1 Tax=Discina gigas TaxID=1032678 RepID=A0ABR3G9F6_9PEZI